MATYNPRNYKFSTDLSFGGVFPVEGFLSQMAQVPAYSALLVSYHSEVDTVLRLYKSNTINETNKVKIYEKTLLANEKFIKKIPIECDFIQLEVANSEATESVLYMNCGLLYTNQFSSQKWLQSIITDDDNIELKKTTNDFYDDVIRGGFESYEKINITGILESPPTLNEVVGLNDDYNYTDTTTIANIVVSNSNDNSTGIGARQVLVEGVKGDGTEFSTTIDLVAGTSSTNIAIMAVNKMEVVSSGTTNTNLGTIEIVGSNGDILSHMEALRNISNDAYFKVPSGKELVIRDIHLSGFAQGGKLTVLLFEPDTGQNKSLGKFSVDISNTQIKYPINKKISALDVIKVMYTPPATSGEILINVNINGILYPTLNTF